ncbi:glutaryl-CoA dehydrogenase (non-decarboxylating) [Streptacidiphilus sp. MAP12-20]|uniref:acyl-CoA dehydrogenase family protein n=1 Tax=Streptacidiphilus sp. MAP12-20 TaxID=3156299 RepID=UPI00351911D7
MSPGHDQELAREFLRRQSDARALGAMVPPAHGGLGLSHAEYGEINRVVAEVSPSRQSLLTVHGMVCRALARWGTPAQRAEFLPELATGAVTGAFALTEEGAGSDVRRVALRARRTAGGWVLDGRKQWLTFGRTAQLFLVFARAEDAPEAAHPAGLPGGGGGHVALLVRRDDPGVYLRPAPPTSGFADAELAELELRDCRVPEGRALGRPGTALTHVAADSLVLGRLCVAFGASGLARAALSAALRRSVQREQFTGPLHRLQLVRGLLADAAVAVDGAELLCRRAARALDDRDEWAMSHVLTAKLAASRAATTATRTAAQLHGAAGLVDGGEVDRQVRDARVLEIIEGSTELLQDLVAEQALARHRADAAAEHSPRTPELRGGSHAA